VVRVTSLDDAGPGSLREALAGGNRTIIFDVAGDIVLTNYLNVTGAFVTIDGLTAPSPGITLRNRGLIIRGKRGAHDVIVRGIRVRNSAIDGIQVAYGAYNVVIDHVSVAGSQDGNIDITENSHDVTVSWSILAGNTKNMLVKYDPSRVTLHHNVFTDSLDRNPEFRINNNGGIATETTGDVRNNVIANWANGYGTVLHDGAWANVVNNYYTASRKAIMLRAARAYVRGNQSADGRALDGIGNEANPFPSMPVDTEGACAAARRVLAEAGVRPLDSVDQEHLARIPVPACSAATPGLENGASSLALVARRDVPGARRGARGANH
jgi:pectate lyase